MPDMGDTTTEKLTTGDLISGVSNHGDYIPGVARCNDTARNNLITARVRTKGSPVQDVAEDISSHYPIQISGNVFDLHLRCFCQPFTSRSYKRPDAPNVTTTREKDGSSQSLSSLAELERLSLRFRALFVKMLSGSCIFLGGVCVLRR